MTILHIITGLNVGGAENMLAKLLEASADAARDAVVLSLLEPGPLAERIRASGVRVETLNMKRGLVGPGDALRLSRLVRTIAPDVLHGWMYHGNLAASLARLALGDRVALIWNIRHSLGDPQRETRTMRMLLRLSAALSGQPDAIIYNSQAARRQHGAHGFRSDRALILPNGFDCQAYFPDPAAAARLRTMLAIAPEATVVGHVARLHPMKDHALLVEAVGLARAQGADLHLVMIGSGLEDPPPPLRTLVDRFLPPDRVTLLGVRSDIGALMPGFDMLALSSAWGEAFPNVLGEALACGVPTVATNVGDSALIVGDEGIVVPPGDRQAFAAALVTMARMPANRRRSMGETGRLRVERDYSIGTIANSYRCLHDELSANRAHRIRTGNALSRRQAG